jgi:endonuclease-3
VTDGSGRDSLVVVGSEDSIEATVDDPAAGGSYVLIFGLETTLEAVTVGALGVHQFAAGEYAYVGSAFGPGGFGRVERHRRHLDGDDGTVHWHVDALTTRPEASFVGAVLVPAADVECAVARRLPPGPVAGFGSSDCACRSHLACASLAVAGRCVSAALEEGRRTSA